MGEVATDTDGLSRYFNRDALLLALIIGVLPNLFFLAVMPFYIAHRILSPVLYLAVGLLSLVLPKPAIYAAFFAVAVIDILLILMIAFHLPLDATLRSVTDLNTLNLGGSVFYVVFVTLVIGTALGAAYLLGRHKPALKSASPLLAALMAFLFVGLNMKVNNPYAVQYEGPMDSALMQTGLTAETIAVRETNLLIVMVEGLGAYADPDDRNVLARKLEAVSGPRYALEAGTSYYNGSTTGAASRELCGKWGDFTDYMDAPAYNCLPRQLAERGYETIAMHGFDVSMFRRDLWYPGIGFTSLNFKAQLAADYDLPRRCGSVFDGLCDTDLGPLVAAKLKSGDAPKMIYWLTLNSHIPFEPKTNGALACKSADAAIDNVQVCQLTELWGDVFDAAAAIAADPELPPTDILVVGDHHTPMWERKAKDKFKLGQVDWYLLRDKRGKAQAAQLASKP